MYDLRLPQVYVEAIRFREGSIMICKHCKKPIREWTDREYARYGITTPASRNYKHLHSRLGLCDDGQHYAEPEEEK